MPGFLLKQSGSLYGSGTPGMTGSGGVIRRIMSVASTNLIGLWPLNEVSGTTVQCINNSALSVAGGYTGVTLGQPGPFGLVAPLFDGLNDFANIFSAALAALFNKDEGSFLIFSKVANAGVWTDGVNRRHFILYADANNYTQSYKSLAANEILWFYNAAATTESVAASTNSISWLQILITWSKSADQVKAYLNTSQVGATQTSLGLWAGALTAVRIGSTIGAGYFSGWLSCAALLNRPITLAENNYIYGGGPN